jgi:recyclin-1
MLGHVYVVEDARDVAQIVRDVTRYGGAYRPEVSLISAVSQRPQNVRW